MIPQNTNWNFPTAIWFGNGRIKEIVDACKQLKVQNPLFVTDEGLVNLSIVQDTTDILKAAGIKFNVYSNVQGNPTGKNVTEGVAFYKANGHDSVIAFGGGSAFAADSGIFRHSG